MTAPGAATLPGSRRLKTQRHFKAVYGRGRRASGQWLTVVALRHRAAHERGPHERAGADEAAGATATRERARTVDRGNVRVGVSVSKDHGGAVRRNKLKRLLREAFRLERQHLPAGLDLVLIPRQRADDFPLAALRQELLQLVQRALAGGDARPRRRS